MPSRQVMDQYLYETLTSLSGLRGTYDAWQRGQVPPLPWFTFAHAKGGEFQADDRNYAKLGLYRVDLYQASLDPATEEAFESAMDHLGPYKSFQTWVPSENCWLTTYELALDYGA